MFQFYLGVSSTSSINTELQSWEKVLNSTLTSLSSPPPLSMLSFNGDPLPIILRGKSKIEQEGGGGGGGGGGGEVGNDKPRLKHT